MTKYASRKALVVGEDTGIGLAIAKRLVEGGATVLLTARTAQDRVHAGSELGSAARVLAPEAVEAGLGPDGDIDLLFADAVPTVLPLLRHLGDGGAIVLTAPAPSPVAVTALAAELVSRGIRVNAVAPGCIAAPGAGAAPLPPMGRLGAAEEVARAALFLATEATFTTGARLPVDGGLGPP
ncbi:SDR family oxidoreductase [Streptomyces sp. NPDC060022]|uniref:SDR family oxidoreductase n=1 Tax=Streptomyces sp. NPDC060022 TaxID=3347039 RepID=UPI003697BE73